MTQHIMQHEGEVPGLTSNPADRRGALRGLRTSVEQIVTFGAGGNATDHQLYGWSVPETGFTWTDGTEAALNLRCPRAPFGGFIEIAASPFYLQHIAVRLNGRLIGESTVSNATVLAYYFEPVDEEQFVVTLEVPGARIPNEAMANPRRIALAVQSVLVASLLEPRPALPRLNSAIELAAPDGADALSAATALTGLAPALLATRFENLSGNCEFGFFQRKCGAEPLSLLRFSDAVAQSVYRGLNTDFGGLADDLGVEPSGIGSGEWMTHDRAYRFWFHTFVHMKDVPLADMEVREAKRLRYLRRKFLEDVATSRKIFVCIQMREPQQPYLPEEIMPMMLALNRRAPNIMLFVTPATEGVMPGSVELMMPGVLRGNIRCLGPRTNPAMAPLAAWLEVCANAWLMCQDEMETV